MPINARLTGLFIVACAVGATTFQVRAQDVPIPSLIDRGVRDFLGREDRQPGAYASPSATDLVPDPRDVGAAPNRGLQRYEPIALPKQTSRSSSLGLPKLDLPDIPDLGRQDGPAGSGGLRGRLTLRAVLAKGGPPIPNGLVWRLYSQPQNAGMMPMLIASSEGNVAEFDVKPGPYILHVGFGYAGLIERVNVELSSSNETVTLDAGGLKLNAVSGTNQKIDPTRLSFDIYTGSDNQSDADLVAADVPPEKILRLNAGTYHVVSNYGSINAQVKADIRVEAGKLTEATLQQQAALLNIKLVREKGGEAIADTAWSITTASGDPVKESVGAFATMILAAGDYVAVARNRDKIYQRPFEVTAGKNQDVEVLTSDLAQTGSGFEGSGD